MIIKLGSSKLEIQNSGIYDNNFLAIIGENASGKTSLLQELSNKFNGKFKNQHTNANNIKSTRKIEVFDNGLNITKSISFLLIDAHSKQLPSQIFERSANDVFTKYGMEKFNSSRFKEIIDLDSYSTVKTSYNKTRESKIYFYNKKNTLDYFFDNNFKLKFYKNDPVFIIMAHISSLLRITKKITAKEYNKIISSATDLAHKIRFRTSDVRENVEIEKMLLFNKFIEENISKIADLSSSCDNLAGIFDAIVAVRIYNSIGEENVNNMISVKLMDLSAPYKIWFFNGKNVHRSSGQYRMYKIAIELLLFLEDNQNKDVIVAIDEADVHLHPKWIIMLSDILDSVKFDRKINYILTAHNPLFLTSFKKEQVLQLKKNKFYN